MIALQIAVRAPHAWVDELVDVQHHGRGACKKRERAWTTPCISFLLSRNHMLLRAPQVHEHRLRQQCGSVCEGPSETSQRPHRALVNVRHTDHCCVFFLGPGAGAVRISARGVVLPSVVVVRSFYTTTTCGGAIHHSNRRGCISGMSQYLLSTPPTPRPQDVQRTQLSPLQPLAGLASVISTSASVSGGHQPRPARPWSTWQGWCVCVCVYLTAYVCVCGVWVLVACHQLNAPHGNKRQCVPNATARVCTLSLPSGSPLCLSLSLSLSLPPSLCLSLCRSVCLSLFLAVSLAVSIYLSLPPSLPLSLCLSVCLSLSLSPPPPRPLPRSRSVTTRRSGPVSLLVLVSAVPHSGISQRSRDPQAVVPHRQRPCARDEPFLLLLLLLLLLRVTQC
jgi:hypothetical protein